MKNLALRECSERPRVPSEGWAGAGKRGLVPRLVEASAGDPEDGSAGSGSTARSIWGVPRMRPVQGRRSASQRRPAGGRSD